MSTNAIDRSRGSATAAPRVPRHLTSTLQGIATSDGAGVKLTRIIGQPGLPDLDPFLMLDAFNSGLLKINEGKSNGETDAGIGHYSGFVAHGGVRQSRPQKTSPRGRRRKRAD